MPRDVLGLTLMTLFAFGGAQELVVDLAVSAIALFMLVDYRRWRSIESWVFLALLMSIALGLRWFEADNHQFLLTYWTWTVVAILLSQSTTAARVASARALGLVFLLAAVWKVRGGEYDGTFWLYTLLTDQRVAITAMKVGELSMAAAANNYYALMDMQNPTLDIDAVVLVSSERLATIATAISVLGIAIEGALAILFLVPWKEHQMVAVSGLRVAGVGVFMMTYVVVPVIGFAWTITVMTIATLPSEASRKRTTLIVLGAALTVLRGLWTDATWRGVT